MTTKKPAEVARERIAEGFPQVAGVVAVVGRYGLQKGRLHFAHVYQEVDRDEDYAEERHPEVESPGDSPRMLLSRFSVRFWRGRRGL